MEYHISNLKGRPRRVTFQGREYVVAPLTLIQPGILNGSQGALLYPEDEIAATVDAWNGMPILLNHPVNGSGRDPGIYNEFGLGTVYRAQYGKALQAEGWFDVERCNNIASGLIIKIEQGEPVELSTGLRVAADVQSGEYNGQPYIAIARNYRPDHLAILPTAVGACSINDGCGVNNELSHEQIRSQLHSALCGRKSTDEVGCYIVDVFDDYFIYEEGSKLFRLSYTMKDDEVTLALAGPTEVEREVSYKLTNNVKESAMTLTAEKRSAMIGTLVTNCSCWKDQQPVLNDLSDDALTLVNNVYAKMSEMSQELSTLKTQNEGLQKIVDIANAGIEVGNVLYTVNSKGEWDKADKAKPQVSMADLPADVRADLEYARNMRAAERKTLSDAILSIDNTPYTVEDLNAMDVVALNKLFAATKGKKKGEGDDEEGDDEKMMAKNREGQFLNPPPVKNGKIDQTDLLGVPSWDFPSPVAK